MKAQKKDIEQLILMRIAFLEDENGPLCDDMKASLQLQLDDYYQAHLNDDLSVFMAKDNDRIVSTVFLVMYEMPANLRLHSGRYGVVLNVYTLPEYRRHGLCTALIREMKAEAKAMGLERLDLKATQAGKAVYLNCGFEEVHSKYTEMSLYL